MKKFIIALAVVSLSSAAIFAGRCHRGGCDWNQPSYVEAAPVSAVSAEPAIPVCTTTRQVPYTAYKTEVVHVAPIREEIPQAPEIVAVPQADLVVRHKQAPIIRPDLICRTKQPCKYVCKERPPLVRYSCPVGTNSCGSAPVVASPCC